MKRDPNSGGAKLELGKNLALQPFMKNNLLSGSKRSLICRPQLSCSSGQSIEKHSVKQENLDNHSLPNPQESKSCGSKRKVNEMPRFDLNIAASTWDDSSSNRVIEQVVNERNQRIEAEGLLLKGCGPLTVPLLPKKDNESDSRLNPTRQEFDSGVCLDLQLKQPCIPGPRFNWTDTGPDINDSSTELADLSLSLASKLSGESSSLKPEQSKESIEKNRDEVELGLQKIMRPTHVKSEQCEVTMLDVASAEAGSSNLRTNHSKERAIQVKQPEIGSQMDKKQIEISLDAKETEDTISSKTCLNSKLEIDLNADPVDPGAYISASAPPEASEITNSSKSLYYDEAHKSICFTGNTEENVEKVSISVSKSVEVEGNELDAATDLTGVGETATGSLPGSPTSKENETTACDGGNGDYTDDIVSESRNSADRTHMEADRSSDVSANVDETEAPAEEDEESCDLAYDSNTSDHVGETVLEQLDDEDEFEYEDVEITVSNDEGESSIERLEERKLQDEEIVDSKPEDGKDKYIENPNGAIGKRELGTAPGSALQVEPSEKRSSDFVGRGNQGAVGRGGNNNRKWRGGHSRREVFVANGRASNQEARRGKRGRPIMKYTGPNQSSYRETITKNSVPASSQTEGGRYSNNTYRRGEPHRSWNREESRSDRFHNAEDARRLQELGRQRSDFTWTRRDPHRLKMVHEDAYAVASDIRGDGRPVKKWFRDEREVHNANEVRISGRFQNANRPRVGSHFRVDQNYGENFLLNNQDGISDHSFSNLQEHYEEMANAHGRITKLIDRGPIQNRRKLPFQLPLQHPYLAQDNITVDREGARPIPVQGPRGVGSSQNIDMDPRQTRGAFQPSPYKEHDSYAVDAEFANGRRFDERQGVARPIRQQHQGQRRVPPVVENSDLRPNRYHFKKGRNSNGYGGAPTRRGRY